VKLRAAVLVALLALAGCGEDAASPPAGEMSVEDVGAEHIHGLGVNPADDSLLIATHYGLFRAAPAEDTTERVGESRQDTMGFTVVGPDRFLGSGHPDALTDLPPLLGLIRSDDAGRSWGQVSLLGEADFHVLRAAERRIYGYDATEGRLLVSEDSGRSWSERSPPAPVLDLAIDPRDAARVVVTSEAGLYMSGDAGATWRPLPDAAPGLLAWTDGLVLVDGSGAVWRSTDSGRLFRTAGRIGGQPAALSSDGDDLYVALHDNTVKLSDDGGRSWSVRVRG